MFLCPKNLRVYGAIGLMLFAALGYAAEGARRLGEKWATDVVLRQGMDNIRHAMVASQESIEKERFGAQDYQRLAEVVDRNVSMIVKNCKLSKEADKAFHLVVLTDLTGSAQLMRTSQKIEVRRAGALGVMQSLRNYGEYFQHPGWDVGVAKVR